MEIDLFPDMRGQRLFLRTVQIQEQLVLNFTDTAMMIFKDNTAGPIKYLNVYKKYANLLNNKAEQDVSAFLRERHSLMALKKVSSKS